MVRWARQKALDRGLLASSQRGVWEVTPEGREFLQAELEAATEATETEEAYSEMTVSFLECQQNSCG
jgi:restriction endonuclease Mrr